jgi:hydroxymethylglutaryl-CoA lyase
VPTEQKVEIIDLCTQAGFPRIEVTSYSRPDHVPAFRDASEVLRGIRRRADVYYKATCPNPRAVDRALADLEAGFGANELSLLVSATEGHSQRNLRSSREAQWNNVEAMVQRAGGRFRLVGVISVAFGCPFEGRVDEGVVIADAARFAGLGVEYVALGDTTGLGTPASIRHLFRRMVSELPTLTAIAHFHNSRGTGLSNCLAAFEAGCRYFDSSFGGVGGHPTRIQYGEGMTGNVASEDLVNLFESLGVSTGLDLDLVLKISRRCEEVLGRELLSMVARTGFGLLPAREHAHA